MSGLRRSLTPQRMELPSDQTRNTEVARRQRGDVLGELAAVELPLLAPTVEQLHRVEAEIAAQPIGVGDGTFRTADELHVLYRGEDIGPDRGVIAYCRIGERSAHTWFVLHELLGYPSVENYDGSWTEYGSLVGVPVER